MARNRRNRRRRSFKEHVEVLGQGFRYVAARAVPMAGLVVAGLGIPAVILGTYTFAVSSDYFALKNVELAGLERTERDPFLSAVGLQAGMNIFDVDPEAVETNAKAQPWIREAKIERRLPDFILISVQEHQPAAMLVDAGYLLVSTEGVPFKALDAADDTDAMFALPLLSGLTREELKTEEGKVRFRQAMDALQAYEKAGLARLYPLSEIHLDKVMGVSFVTREMGAEVRLGMGRWDERMTRLKSVLDAILQDGEEVDYILVDEEENLSRVTVGRRKVAGMDATTLPTDR